MGAAKVTIYTTGYCGYCFAAKRLLGKRGVRYEEVAVDSRPDLRSWLAEVSGQRTVPQVFINGQPIGGHSELSALEASQRLDSMLATPPAVDNPPLRS